MSPVSNRSLLSLILTTIEGQLKTVPAGCLSTDRDLTHTTESTRGGLGMNPTQYIRPSATERGL